MRKEYILLLIVLLILCSCKKKNNNTESEINYNDISCYREIQDDDIYKVSRIDVRFIQNVIDTLNVTHRIIFTKDSVKFLNNEVKYYKKYYQDKNKIKGITAKFESDNSSYTGIITADFNSIKSSELDKIDLPYNINKRIGKIEFSNMLESDNYICE